MKSDHARITRYISNTVCSLAIMEVVLMFSSWIVSTAFPETGLRSLINSEGIRWFLGSFSANLGNDISVWLLLSAMAYGCVSKSEIGKLPLRLSARVPLTFRERLAIVLVAAEVLIVLMVMLLLTSVPQAILLSVTGELFPSSFSRSIVPVADFVLVATAVTYGLVTDNVKTVGDVVGCLVYGCQKAAPLFVLYVFACQLFCSAGYVFFIFDY